MRGNAPVRFGGKSLEKVFLSAVLTAKEKRNLAGDLPYRLSFPHKPAREKILASVRIR
jgi:hypothetical protein